MVVDFPDEKRGLSLNNTLTIPRFTRPAKFHMQLPQPSPHLLHKKPASKHKQYDHLSLLYQLYSVSFLALQAGCRCRFYRFLCSRFVHTADPIPSSNISDKSRQTCAYKSARVRNIWSRPGYALAPKTENRTPDARRWVPNGEARKPESASPLGARCERPMCNSNPSLALGRDS